MPGVIGLNMRAIGSKANPLVGYQATLKEKQVSIRAAEHEVKKIYNQTQYIPCLLQWHLQKKNKEKEWFQVRSPNRSGQAFLIINISLHLNCF